MPGPVFEALTTITLESGAAINQYTIVGVNTSGKVVVATAANDTTVIGVAQNAASAAGEAVTVAIAGVTKVVAGATINPGVRVSAEAGGTGQAITAASASMPIGVLLSAGADNKLAAMLIRSGTVLA